MSDQVRHAFCACAQFELWYTDGRDIGDVCRCGHRRVEHLDGLRSCVGDVTVYRPAVKP